MTDFILVLLLPIRSSNKLRLLYGSLDLTYETNIIDILASQLSQLCAPDSNVGVVVMNNELLYIYNCFEMHSRKTPLQFSKTFN